MNFIKRLKYAEHKIFCICVDLYKFFEPNNCDKKYEKVKLNNILIEKYKNTLENLDFEQHYWSRTSIGIYKIGHDSIRLMKWLAYYDRSYYENTNHYELIRSV